MTALENSQKQRFLSRINNILHSIIKGNQLSVAYTVACPKADKWHHFTRTRLTDAPLSVSESSATTVFLFLHQDESLIFIFFLFLYMYVLLLTFNWIYINTNYDFSLRLSAIL